MDPAVGHPHTHGLLDEQDGPPGDEAGIDGCGTHSHHLATEGVQCADPAGADVVEGGLEFHLGRAWDRAGHCAHEQVAQGIRCSLCVGSGWDCGKQGGQGGQGGEAASHDVSFFVVDLSSADF